MIPIPTEYQDQCALVQWLELIGLKFTAIPNGTWTPSQSQKAMNYKSGLRKGFPDMVVIIPKEKCKEERTVMLFIEMKREKGGIVSEHQKGWIDSINGVADCEAVICEGFEKAQNYILTFLK